MENNFSENLKRIRKECNLTQKQVANAIFVAKSCYANWEQGRSEPSIEMLIQLSKIFEISIDELLNGDF